jgi:signal transduction histidine kinase/ActR/RegA family two-component response regulator
MKETSLRARLTWAAMVTTFMALLLCAGALLAYELSTYRNAWVTDLRTQADLISHASAAALVFNDPAAARENLSLLKLQPRLRAAAVYARDGSLFASYVGAGNAHPLPARFDGTAAGASGFHFSGSTLELTYPVIQDAERVGTVYLQARHDVWTRVATYGLILAGVMAAALAVAAAVFSRLLRQVTRPLQEMTDVAQEVMTHRRWQLRAAETEYQDIAVLVRAFNGMLAEVETRTGELEVEMAERVHAEQELRLADRRKDEFLATLAHELRNPLAPMATAVALVRRPATPDSMRDKAVSILERQIGHMVRLIDDLLDVSRVTTGKLSLHREAVDLPALLHSVVDIAQPAAAQKGLALGIDGDTPPLVLSGDPARLAQVFSNLLNNACRYTDAGGRIDVSMVLLPHDVEVAVQDSGIGVEPAMQARIFELFEQGDKTLERGNSGLGIGLTLARQLVQLHGGDIRVHSEGRHRGARFTVRLPISRAQVQAAPVVQTPSASTLSGLRVLVADDNVDFATSLADLLHAMGHEVQVVHDGETAWTAASQAPPDIALLDIGMPRLNGYELARRLRADAATRGIRLVAITGWGQAADKQAAEDAGFDRHLVKPVIPENLVAVMASLGSVGKATA